MFAEEKTTAPASPFKVVVSLRGANAEPQSFRFWDQQGTEHTASVKKGALARALALVLVKFRNLNQPTVRRQLKLRVDDN